MMNRIVMLTVLSSLSPLLAGCPCNDHVEAGTFVGDVTPDQIDNLRQSGAVVPTLPATICPGELVTVGFQGTTDSVDVHVDHDDFVPPLSGTYSTPGPLHANRFTFRPTQTTTIMVKAGCAQKTITVRVIREDDPEPVRFDAFWDSDCRQMTYQAFPLNYSDSVRATTVASSWMPPQGCTVVEPYLRGFDPTGSHDIALRAPGMFTPLTPPVPVHLPTGGNPLAPPGAWQFAYDRSHCNHDNPICDHSHNPETFLMNLTCR